MQGVLQTMQGGQQRNARSERTQRLQDRASTPAIPPIPAVRPTRALGPLLPERKSHRPLGQYSHEYLAKPGVSVRMALSPGFWKDHNSRLQLSDQRCGIAAWMAVTSTAMT
jgi:hypothetical protein